MVASINEYIVLVFVVGVFVCLFVLGGLGLFFKGVLDYWILLIKSKSATVCVLFRTNRQAWML